MNIATKALRRASDRCFSIHHLQTSKWVLAGGHGSLAIVDVATKQDVRVANIGEWPTCMNFEDMPPMALQSLEPVDIKPQHLIASAVYLAEGKRGAKKLLRAPYENSGLDCKLLPLPGEALKIHIGITSHEKGIVSVSEHRR